MAAYKIFQGDVFDCLPKIASDSINLVITSPPYWGLREYGVEGQLGQEPTMEAYLDNLLKWTKEVYRVLKPAGSFILNLGGSYCTIRSNGHDQRGTTKDGVNQAGHAGIKKEQVGGIYKPKQFLDVGAFAYARIIQETDFICRNRGTWCKPNVPSPIRSRLKQSTESVDWFVKDADKYYFNSNPWVKAITASSVSRSKRAVLTTRLQGAFSNDGMKRKNLNKQEADSPHCYNIRLSKTSCYRGGHGEDYLTRELNYPDDKQTIEHCWRVIPVGEKQQGFELNGKEKQEHVAPFPEALIKPWIESLCPPEGVVLDPFLGSGTTMKISRDTGRSCMGVELNPVYVGYAMKRVNWNNGIDGNIYEVKA